MLLSWSPTALMATSRSPFRHLTQVYTTVLLLLILLCHTIPPTYGQFNEPPGQLREQTFKVLEFENSNINQRFPGALRYYCTFRGKWSEERHPIDFPKSPSWSAPVIISHTNGYRMWTGTEACTAGIESIAEEGFATIITNEFANAGFEALQMVVGERMFNTTDSQNLPPINVTYDHPFISSMVKITPSPDWFVGFSDFRTISYDTETFYNRVVIQSYVWDSGTDGGQTYTALDRDLDPQVPVYRFCVKTEGDSKRKCPDKDKGRIETPPQGQFLDYTGTYIPTPAEFECVLRVGDGEIFPGVPFNDTQIRPPLYVPRPDDDFVDGVSPKDPEFETKTGQANPSDGADGSGSSGAVATMFWAGPSSRAMAATMILSAVVMGIVAELA